MVLVVKAMVAVMALDTEMVMIEVFAEYRGDGSVYSTSTGCSKVE